MISSIAPLSDSKTIKPKFTLVTCVRNEGPYLLEWVVHYKLLGFGRIIVYSNDNDDGSDELLAAMQAHGLIEWRPQTLAEGQSAQMTAYKAVSQELFADTGEHGNYLACLDCDEFLALKYDDTVEELLARYKFPDSLVVNWKHFGSSGKSEYERDLTICRFQSADSSSRYNKLGKCISRINPGLFSLIANHRPHLRNKDERGRVIYATDGAIDVHFPEKFLCYGNNPQQDENAQIFLDICQLNHYAIRSKEEYEWKASRGNGRNSLPFPKHYFDSHDLNAEHDSLAPEKYAASIKTFLNELPPELIDIETRIIETIAKNARNTSSESIHHGKAAKGDTKETLFHSPSLSSSPLMVGQAAGYQRFRT